ARSIVLAPDPERFLSGSVRDRKQDSVAAGSIVRIALPWRHNEDIVDAPLEWLAVNDRRAFAFGDREDGAVGRPVRFALEALRQQRKAGAHGRQHRAAIDRIGITHARTVTAVDITR